MFEKELEGTEFYIFGKDFYHYKKHGMHKYNSTRIFLPEDILKVKNKAKKKILEEIDNKRGPNSVEVDFNAGLEVAKTIIKENL